MSVANIVIIIFCLPSTISSGNAKTLAPILRAIETAYRALSIFDSFVLSVLSSSYFIEFGLIASIKSQITRESEIIGSWKFWMNVFLPADDSLNSKLRTVKLFHRLKGFVKNYFIVCPFYNCRFVYCFTLTSYFL